MPTAAEDKAITAAAKKRGRAAAAANAEAAAAAAAAPDYGAPTDGYARPTKRRCLSDRELREETH